MSKDSPTNLLPDDARKEAKEALHNRSQEKAGEVKLVMPKSQEASEPGVPVKKDSFFARWKRKRQEKRDAEKRRRGETGSAKHSQKISDTKLKHEEPKPELFKGVASAPAPVIKQVISTPPQKMQEKKEQEKPKADVPKVQDMPPQKKKESAERAPVPSKKPKVMAVQREEKKPVIQAKAPEKKAEPMKAQHERKPVLEEAMHQPSEKAPEKYSGPSVNLIPDTLLPKDNGPTWMLPVIMLVFVTGFWVILGGVGYSRAKSAEAKIAEQTSRLTSVNKLIRDSENAKVAAQTLQKQFDAVQGLLDEHIYWTPVLTKLEETTIPDVYYVAINANATTGELSLRAIAKNYEAAARQLRSFESAGNFVTDLTIGEARVENQPDAELPVPIVAFDLQLQLADGILQLLEPQS